MAEVSRDINSLWNECLSEVKKSIPTQSFETWLKPTKPLRIENNNFTISVPNQFFSDWVEEHYLSNIKQSLQTITDKDFQVSFHISSDEKNTSVAADAAPTLTTKQKKPPPARGQDQLNAKYLFDHFVVGNSNQFAHAASLAVAEAPGKTAFNPLLIYSDVGLGKTHLTQAIGNFAMKENTAKRVVYTSLEQFTNEFIESLHKKSTTAFSNYYRTTDILLIDDIQFLTGKESIQEAFFHTFNTLHQKGKQIVLTSDRPPKEIKGIQERLISRFQWGLVVDIQPPDLETRIAILKKKASLENITLQDEILYFIANNITTNIRELEGAFIRLVGYAHLTKKIITPELAQETLKDIITTQSKSISIEYVQKKVCEYFNIPEDKIRDKTRKKEIVFARQIAMFLSKKYTNSSLKTIGLHFGGRDHTTVIHAQKIIQEKQKSDTVFLNQLETISSSIQ